MECATKNNAAYIFSGNWEDQIHHSKTYLRHEGSSGCQRVVHNGEWRDEVRSILGYSRHFAQYKKTHATMVQTGPRILK